ncbi:MAG TPA: M28 family peptidase [Chryseolinea sp.]|nr:M28 family peptidase [Chryseolinea sp.]
MRSISLIFFLLVTWSASGQKKIVQRIEESVNAREIEAHLSFLCADEMRGRDTGSREIDIAANYITSQLKIFGAKPAQNDTSYFQQVLLEKTVAPKNASMIVGTDSFKLKDDLLYLAGSSASLDGDIIFVGYGTNADFENVDVKGKIVVAFAGSNDSTNAVQALFSDSHAKGKIASKHGASALVEIMSLPGLSWPSLTNFLSADRMITQKEDQSAVPHLFMKKSESAAIAALIESKKARGKLRLETVPPTQISAKNVAGIIEGKDPLLKSEWIIISAHYDHIGVKKNQSRDSIFNGARDNGIGTVALLQAAKFLSYNRPKRSILILALTGEEKGLLGSEWYASHPLVPLKQTVLDFNCDGAGYNDKSIISLIDLNRTSVDELIVKASQTFGLGVKGDPAPGQNLYERSDNLNFAVKGIPSVNVAPGIKAFDQELMKYYHQAADEVSTLDMTYVEKFERSFVYAAYLIANATERPTWKKGDKFEAAGIKLYSND